MVTPLTIMRKYRPRFIRVARVCYDMPAFEAVKAATDCPQREPRTVEVVAMFDIGRVCVTS